MAQIGEHFIVLGPPRKLVPNKIVSLEDTQPRPIQERAPERPKTVAFGRRAAAIREPQPRKSAGGLLDVFGFGRRAAQSRGR